MNKVTKLGVSALCGSLAAVSAANAGELTVTGGVDMSWVSQDSAAVGNPIGIGSNLTFKGSGELDNGWTFDLTVAMLNNDVYSNTNVTVDMQGLGKLDFNQGNSGNGIYSYHFLAKDVLAKNKKIILGLYLQNDFAYKDYICLIDFNNSFNLYSS